MAKAKIIIIGGGASGLVAAIVAARQGAKVTVLERMDRVGKKILATGNGRCNISNRLTTSEKFYCKQGGSVIDTVLKAFDLEKTKIFFEELGIDFQEKEEGKLYPRSDQASAVVNVLRYELERLKVDIECQQEVTDIEVGDDKIVVTTSTKKFYGNRLILAAGGRSNPDLGSNGSGFELAKKLGYQVVTPFPSLVQLKTDFPYLKQIAGTKIMGMVRILDGQQHLLKEAYGEILFADYGISGPPVLQVSRVAASRLMTQQPTYAQVDLVSEWDDEALNQKLLLRFERMPLKTVEECFVGFMNSRLIQPILKVSGIELHKSCAEITKKERWNLVKQLKHLQMEITGTHQWNQSQVTAGGISLLEIDPVTLESKKHPKVYVCGEVLDVDGDCGGFNLQWAWSSGAIAGLNAAKEE